MRSDLYIPSTASGSIEKEVPQSMVLPLCSIRRRGFTQDMRWRDGFSRILEYFNLARLYLGIAVSASYSQQSPSFRDHSIFPPPKAEKGHGLFLAAVFLATRASKEPQRARHSRNRKQEDLPQRRKGAKVTGRVPSSRANARDLRKISPFGRNDTERHFACFASWRETFRDRSVREAHPTKTSTWLSTCLAQFAEGSIVLPHR